MRIYHYPMSGQAVAFTRSDGVRTVRPIDSSGHATVILDPGRYVVSVTDCHLAKITIGADESRALALDCAGP